MSNRAEDFFEMITEREPTNADFETMQRAYFERYVREVLVDHERLKRIVDTGVMSPPGDDPYGFVEHAKYEIRQIKPVVHLNRYAPDDYTRASNMLKQGHYDPSCAASLAQRLAQSRMEAHRIKLAYLEQDYDGMEIRPHELKGAENAFMMSQKEKPSVTLQDCVQNYLAAKKDSVTSKSLAAVKAALDRVMEILGSETLIEELSKQPHGILLERTLPRLPANYVRDYKSKGFNLMDIVNGEEPYPVIQDKSLATHWTYTNEFFEWAETRDFLARNPVKGLKPKIKKKGKKEASAPRRNPFTAEQLNILFQSPIYTGRHNQKRALWEKGNHVYRDGYFWLPLIALFTGMREAEILQLTTKDFHCQDGIYYVDINEDSTVEGRDKHVKTVSGVRIVPIHPELVKIGLPQFVEDRREEIEEGESLFGKGITIPEGQEMIKNYSRNFGEYTVRVGIRDSKDNKQVFHSFRNTIHDAFFRAEVSNVQASWIAGHERPQETQTIGDQYYLSERPSLQMLYETICKVEYDIDLSHLYVTA